MKVGKSVSKALEGKQHPQGVTQCIGINGKPIKNFNIDSALHTYHHMAVPRHHRRQPASHLGLLAAKHLSGH